MNNKALNEIVRIFNEIAEKTGADFMTVVKCAREEGIFSIKIENHHPI